MAVATVRLERPPAHVLHPFEGFGAQFNTRLFSRDGQPQPLTPAQRTRLQAAIKNLKPGHSRIFLARGVRAEARGVHRAATELDALMKTISLAQESGADVNLTFWGQGPYANEKKLSALDWKFPNFRGWPDPQKQKWPKALTEEQLTAPREHMRRFAGIIEKARREGFDCVTHATIQNEVNSSGVDIARQRNQRLSMRLYEWLYRLFVDELKARADPMNPTRKLRQAVKIIGGDLVLDGNSHQDDWLEYMHDNMDVPRAGFPRVLDGYSIHVYWEPGGGAMGFPKRLEDRLEKLPATLRRLGITRPLYVTEYGVRKLGTRPEPGRLDGRRIEFMPDIAFQHAWFNALAPQCGCVGLAKWVLYRTDEPAKFGEWGMIDAPNPPAPRKPFERAPTYRVTRLFNLLFEPGWKAAGLGRGAGRMLLASKFAGASGESVVVLNRGSQAQQVRVEGLKKQRTYFAVDWNRAGDGTLKPLPSLTSDGAGAATVTVPRHGVVGLSTRELQL